MLNSKILYVLIWLLFCSLLMQAKSVKVTDDITKVTLKNGLTVFIAEDHQQPEVFGEVVVNVGGKDGPKEATGMAHYLEHMLFKGTRELGTINWEKEKPHIKRIYQLYDSLGNTNDTVRRAEIQDSINEVSVKAQQYALPNEFESLVKKMGGTNIGANTTYDRTVYYNTFPKTQLKKWLELYAHRFGNPVFRGFQAELEVVYEEKNMGLDDNFRQAQNEFMKLFHKNHPYGQRSLIGTVEDLKNPSLNRMKQFFETWYVPNNMALVLSGDVTPEEAMPMIKSTFGRLERKELPERETFEKTTFQGREYHERKMSFLKVAGRGYPTVPSGHSDELPLKVMTRVLNNGNNTGLLDKLNKENELNNAQYINVVRKDRGAGIFYIIPKQLFQSHEAAEQLVAEQIHQLKEGEFPAHLVKAIKKQLYVDWQLSMEDNKDRGEKLAEAFAQGRDLEKYLAYPDRIQQITKEQVVEVANKYLDSNYLAFHLKRGSQDKPKVEKPGYESIEPSRDKKKSVFAKRFKDITVPEQQIDYINFNQAISTESLKDKVKLYHNHYDQNDIYTLTLKFGAGERRLPNLKYVTSVSGFIKVDTMTNQALKTAFDTLGTNYKIYSNRNYTCFQLTGIKENFPESLGLLNKILNNAQFQEGAVDKIVENQRRRRIQERSQIAQIGRALKEYVMHGDSSNYLNRLKMNELKSLETQQLDLALQKSTQFACQVHYTGQRAPEEVSNLINERLSFRDSLEKSRSPQDRYLVQYSENKVFYLEKNDAVQSRIGFYVPGRKYNIRQTPFVEAFNNYFGSGSTALTYREIREYRSLAYAVMARYITPQNQGNKGRLIGYLGTQADKTNDAISAFVGLKKDMPKEKQRIDMLKSYLVNSSITDVPGPRSLSEKIVEWQHEGYKQDPRKRKIKAYRKLKFNDIESFYAKTIKEAPLVMGIVGNTNRFNVDELSQYGKVQEVNKNELFREAWLPNMYFGILAGLF